MIDRLCADCREPVRVAQARRCPRCREAWRRHGKGQAWAQSKKRLERELVAAAVATMTKWERVTAAKAGDMRWCTVCGEDRVDQLSTKGWCPTCRPDMRKLRARNRAAARARTDSGRASLREARARWVVRVKSSPALAEKERQRANEAAKKPSRLAVIRAYRNRRYAEDPAYRSDRLAYSKRQKADPAFKAARRERERSDEWRLKKSIENRRQWARHKAIQKALTEPVPLPDVAAVDWGEDIELEGDDDGRR